MALLPLCKAMAVLVTGAAGFIGAAVSRSLLERGETLVGIDNLNDYYDPALKRARLDQLTRQYGNRFHFEWADFANADDLRRVTEGVEIDAIVHLGAQAGVRYSLENPNAYIQSNLVGHANMLELARHRGVRLHRGMHLMRGGIDLIDRHGRIGHRRVDIALGRILKARILGRAARLVLIL